MIKFHQYWPDGMEPIDVAEFRIEPVRERPYNDEFVKRTYIIHNKKSGESRVLLHFLFTSFPGKFQTHFPIK